MAVAQQKHVVYPLYSSSFTLYRLSPLHHGTESIDNDLLRTLALRFRDLLTGDVLRGVRVGIAPNDDALARVGSLRSVRWVILRSEAEWSPEQEEDAESQGDLLAAQERGIHVEIKYDKAIYTALLLRDVEAKSATPGRTSFSHFPLLLTRMTGSLTQSLLGFLSTTFDCRASRLQLPPSSLRSLLEAYMANVVMEAELFKDIADVQDLFGILLREVEVSLALMLPSAPGALKTVDIRIARGDIWNMVQQGQSDRISPFFAALSRYADHHLALNISHDNEDVIRIARVACGSFVLSSSKLKLFSTNMDGAPKDIQIAANALLMATLVQVAST